MTLTIHTLNELKKAECNDGCLDTPPGNFLQDLQAYMLKVMEDAGPHPVQWDADCEAFAAIEILEDYFRLRRIKIDMYARDRESPRGGSLLPFEREAYDKLRAAHEELHQNAHRFFMLPPKR